MTSKEQAQAWIDYMADSGAIGHYRERTVVNYLAKLIDRVRAEERNKAEARVKELERWISQRIRPHVKNECNGITPADCIDTIREDLAALDDSTETMLDPEDGFEAWKKWFHENCSEWKDVDDVLKELGRDDQEDDQ